MRRVAEVERGGISSEESAARYARGDNPGGTHRRPGAQGGAGIAVPQHQRPEHEEPQDRFERMPGGEKAMPSSRRG